jgi:hypothetical protein
LEEPFSVLPLINMTEGMGLSARESAEWYLEPETYVTETIGGKKKMFTLPSVTDAHDLDTAGEKNVFRLPRY